MAHHSVWRLAKSPHQIFIYSQHTSLVLFYVRITYIVPSRIPIFQRSNGFKLASSCHALALPACQPPTFLSTPKTNMRAIICVYQLSMQNKTARRSRICPICSRKRVNARDVSFLMEKLVRDIKRNVPCKRTFCSIGNVFRLY